MLVILRRIDGIKWHKNALFPKIVNVIKIINVIVIIEFHRPLEIFCASLIVRRLHAPSCGLRRGAFYKRQYYCLINACDTSQF